MSDTIVRRYGVVPVDTRTLLDRIEQAVTSRLVADVPVGVFLSGGIDSSIVASVAARHHPAIDTFSMGFKDARYDESAHAEVVARARDLATRIAEKPRAALEALKRALSLSRRQALEQALTLESLMHQVTLGAPGAADTIRATYVE